MKMKYIILITIFFEAIYCSGAYAQKLYNAAGSATFSFNTANNLTARLDTFSLSTAYQPKGKLIHIGNGEIVGLTEQSSNLYGAIFKTDTSHNNNLATVLYQFTNSNRPTSSFVMAKTHNAKAS